MWWKNSWKAWLFMLAISEEICVTLISWLIGHSPIFSILWNKKSKTRKAEKQREEEDWRDRGSFRQKKTVGEINFTKSKLESLLWDQNKTGLTSHSTESTITPTSVHVHYKTMVNHHQWTQVCTSTQLVWLVFHREALYLISFSIIETDEGEPCTFHCIIIAQNLVFHDDIFLHRCTSSTFTPLTLS